MSYTLDGDSLRFRGEAGTQTSALDVPSAQVLVLQGASVSSAGVLQGLAPATGATDALACGSFAWKTPVAGVATSALNATYAAGVLTSVAQEALPVAGVQAGDRVLLTSQAVQAHNGIYVVTDAGTPGSANFVLTRAHDFQASSLVAGSAVVTYETGASGLFVNTNDEEPDWATDAIAFAQVGGAGEGVVANAVDLAEMAHGTEGGELLVYGAPHADANVSRAPKLLAQGTQGFAVRAGAGGEPEYAALEHAGLADAAVQTAHLGAQAVQSAKLQDGAVGEIHLNEAVTAAYIADLAVASVNLQDGGFTPPDGLVSTTLLADSAVQTTHLAALGVSRAKVGNAQVTTALLSDNCVSSTKMPTSAVTTAKLADSSVDETRLPTTLYSTSLSAIGGASGQNTLSFSLANQVRALFGGVARLNVFSTGASSGGTWTAVSDRKSKTLQGPISSDPLRDLDYVDGVEWVWKANGTAGAGIVAQDFARVCPQAVRHDAALNGYVVDYNAVNGFGICCAKALKQQTVQLQDVLSQLDVAQVSTTDLQAELDLQEEVAGLNARLNDALALARSLGPREPRDGGTPIR